MEADRVALMQPFCLSNTSTVFAKNIIQPLNHWSRIFLAILFLSQRHLQIFPYRTIASQWGWKVGLDHTEHLWQTQNRLKFFKKKESFSVDTSQLLFSGTDLFSYIIILYGTQKCAKKSAAFNTEIFSSNICIQLLVSSLISPVTSNFQFQRQTSKKSETL